MERIWVSDDFFFRLSLHEVDLFITWKNPSIILTV